VSRSQLICRNAKQAKSGPVALFETRDFYLACFLRCSGYELLDLRTEGPRKVFVFVDRPTRSADVLAFYRDGAAVPPLAFSATIKDMKALLHNV
jgi:hypothetical protein